MPPIPVYTDSPVATKPSGVTPQTASQPPQASQNHATPATTTASPTRVQAAYPQALPGAAPSLPTATGAAQAHPSYMQPAPSQDLKREDGPPLPEPGAVPTSTSVRSHLPPPPKVGEKYVPPQITSASQSASMPYPRQMSIPSPTIAYPAQQHGTSTAAAPSSAYGGDQGTGGSLQHPPGYQQNVNASELDGYQRSAIFRNDSAQQHSQPEEGVWNSAKKWAQATGEKLAAAETEVWKRINKE
ncbi:hypothetical protein BJ170DRAFT_343084 [Xylariales sp. AK1849]|nr:hypothetical protein BJ170DRAFT_343084 [Xylariales sp. AK1849]